MCRALRRPLLRFSPGNWIPRSLSARLWLQSSAILAHTPKLKQVSSPPGRQCRRSSMLELSSCCDYRVYCRVGAAAPLVLTFAEGIRNLEVRLFGNSAALDLAMPLVGIEVPYRAGNESIFSDPPLLKTAAAN